MATAPKPVDNSVGRNSRRRLGGSDLGRIQQAMRADALLNADGTVQSVDGGTNLTGGPITTTGTLNVSVTKSGATQVAAGAVAGELWYTSGHATLPDNVVMRGV